MALKAATRGVGSAFLIGPPVTQQEAEDIWQQNPGGGLEHDCQLVSLA